MTVRTRIAPSPTGDPHVGTAYIALFNYCYAKKHGGQFILRIENTDRLRSSEESEREILRSLRWLGLEWDEGPDIGGPYGPYRQSERLEIYREHAQRLIESGRGFRCFCTREDLDEMRARQTGQGRRGYDGRCLRLSANEVRTRLDESRPFVVRLKVPDEGSCDFRDELRGDISIDWDQVDMQILLKQDGMPTYHLANVVDDHLMGISHVIRGEEWINSAPKHLLLYESLDWQPPRLCHLPLLRNPDKSKLSKRKNPTSILFYERSGFLPEALVNFLGLISYTMPNEEEKYSLEGMLEDFDPARISLGGPIFDRQKLAWLNGRWIREELSDEEFADRVARWALNREYLGRMIPLVKPRIQSFGELAPLTEFFFRTEIELSADELKSGNLDEDDVRVALELVLAGLEALTEWNQETVQAVMRRVCDLMELKLRHFLKPFYLAVTGSTSSTPLFDSMELLGRDLCRARLRDARRLLGPFQDKAKKSYLKKALKELRF